MMNNQYFDEHGNRIRLDTRFFEECGKPSRHKFSERQRQSVFRRVFSVGMFCFCAWFVFGHCAILWRQFRTIVEFIGVSACGAYMALCIDKMIKMFEE